MFYAQWWFLCSRRCKADVRWLICWQMHLHGAPKCPRAHIYIYIYIYIYPPFLNIAWCKWKDAWMQEALQGSTGTSASSMYRAKVMLARQTLGQIVTNHVSWSMDGTKVPPKSLGKLPAPQIIYSRTRRTRREWGTFHPQYEILLDPFPTRRVRNICPSLW